MTNLRDALIDAGIMDAYVPPAPAPPSQDVFADLSDDVFADVGDDVFQDIVEE